MLRETYVGGAGKSIAALNRLAPDLTDRLLSRFGYQPQLTDEPKSDRAPNNLYDHIVGFDEAQGSFDREARSVSLYTGLRLHPGLYWGCMAALAGMGYMLMPRRKPSRPERQAASGRD